MISRIALAAHHVDEVAAPGRVDAARDLEHVVDLVDPRAGQRCRTPASSCRTRRGRARRRSAGSAHQRAGDAEAGLHLVEDEQRVVLVARAGAARRRNSGRKWLSPPSPWIGSMMKRRCRSGGRVTACSISASASRLERVDRRRAPSRVDGEAELRVVDARPVELREVLGLARVGGVGQRQRVAAAAVERARGSGAPGCPFSPRARPRSSSAPSSRTPPSARSRPPSAPPSTKNRCGEGESRHATRREGLDELGAAASCRCRSWPAC